MSAAAGAAGPPTLTHTHPATGAAALPTGATSTGPHTNPVPPNCTPCLQDPGVLSVKRIYQYYKQVGGWASRASARSRVPG